MRIVVRMDTTKIQRRKRLRRHHASVLRALRVVAANALQKGIDRAALDLSLAAAEVRRARHVDPFGRDGFRAAARVADVRKARRLECMVASVRGHTMLRNRIVRAAKLFSVHPWGELSPRVDLRRAIENT